MRLHGTQRFGSDIPDNGGAFSGAPTRSLATTVAQMVPAAQGALSRPSDAQIVPHPG